MLNAIKTARHYLVVCTFLLMTGCDLLPTTPGVPINPEKPEWLLIEADLSYNVTWIGGLTKKTFQYDSLYRPISVASWTKYEDSSYDNRDTLALHYNQHNQLESAMPYSAFRIDSNIEETIRHFRYDEKGRLSWSKVDRFHIEGFYRYHKNVREIVQLRKVHDARVDTVRTLITLDSIGNISTINTESIDGREGKGLKYKYNIVFTAYDDHPTPYSALNFNDVDLLDITFYGGQAEMFPIRIDHIPFLPKNNPTRLTITETQYNDEGEPTIKEKRLRFYYNYNADGLVTQKRLFISNYPEKIMDFIYKKVE
ncbi:hypothetical protein [Echinicola strongylocentroti]|nr:hypothetical protein [Echinicola strongylocentroti]